MIFMKKTKSRIYVCHTFYHVYVSILKEMKVQRQTVPSEYQKADIALSTISTNFENLGERLGRTGIFDTVYMMMKNGKIFFRNLQNTGQITATL